MMMYVFSKFIAFILSALAAISSQIANMKKVEKVETETVQEVVQINEPVKEEVVEEPEPEEVVIKVQQPTYYADHVYVDGLIDVQIVEVEDAHDSYLTQSIVDDPYKGVSFQYYSCTYIGDHSHEGFANLPLVQIGDVMHWKGKTYECFYADDNAYLDGYRQIVLSNGQYLYDQNCKALVTCKNDYIRYVRLFKEV